MVATTGYDRDKLTQEAYIWVAMAGKELDKAAPFSVLCGGSC
jgi:hypothetical protein